MTNWGILTTKLGNTDITDGNILYGADLVDTFDACQRLVAQVYTGTGFDSTISSAATDTQDHEMDAITAANVAGGTYLKITIVGIKYVQARGYSSPSLLTTAARVRLKIQTKEVGGSYGDVLAYTTVLQSLIRVDNVGDRNYVGDSFVYYHLLTAGEKSNGVQVKLFSESYTDDSNNHASFTNVQTIIEMV